MGEHDLRRRCHATTYLAAHSPCSTVRLVCWPERAEKGENLGLDFLSLDVRRSLALQTEIELLGVVGIFVSVEPLAKDELRNGKVDRFVEGITTAVVNEDLEGRV